MIKGFIGTSLVDYPDKIAAVIFYGGCNYRCPFCHNIDLVIPERVSCLPDINESEIINKIASRAGFIDGVVFSGGEPTLYEDSILRLMTQIKTMQTCQSLKVKLDTNGSNPLVLKSLLDKNLLDYVAMDIKTTDILYDEVSKVFNSFTFVKQSIDLLLSATVDYEFRVTVVPGLVDQETLQTIAKLVNGSRRLALQQFKPDHVLNPALHSLKPYSKQELQSMAEMLRNQYSFEVLLRA